jgi:hypothetical protein
MGIAVTLGLAVVEASLPILAAKAIRLDFLIRALVSRTLPEAEPGRRWSGELDTSAERRHTMTISISLTPDQERTLEELARQSGKDPSAYAVGVLTAYLNGVRSNPEKTFEEILAPIWEGWRQSGMTEDEIDDLFGRELQDVRRERHQREGTT